MKRLLMPLSILALTACGLSPIPGFFHTVGVDCMFPVETTARIFHVAFSSPASSSLVVTPWICLTGSAGKYDEVIPEKFYATADEASHTITVWGFMRRYFYKPGDNCPRATLYLEPKAATLSIPVTAAPGTYVVKILAPYFTIERPQYPGYGPDPNYPEPLATQTIVIQ